MTDRGVGGDRVVGIDLGTSNTVCAYVDELDQVRVIADPDGHRVQPSVVGFHPSGGVVVGLAAKQRRVIDPKHTVYSAKRMIGQPFHSYAVQETARRVPFEVREGPNELAMIATRAGEFAIPEISAIVLDHVRKVASSALAHEIGRAVVTVPASFTDVQRQSTAAAGALAGLTVVRMLNEPTAAALAYGSTRRLNEIIAVYDWGGGTFDITILQLQDQVYTVLGTSGDAFLGGEDMDERLVDAMVATFLKEHRIDLREDDIAMMRLRAVAEHTKIELSRRSRAMVKVEEIAFAPDGHPLALEAKLTRDELVGGIGDLIDRTFASCEEAMLLAGIRADRISDVVLVGGSTRIPHVRQRVGQFFGVEPRTDVDPEDAIATGAALQAASIELMLSRAPQRPLASVPIPVDDLIADVIAESRAPLEVEVERAPSRIAEVKRPKRGTDMFSGTTRPATSTPRPRRRSPSDGDPAKAAARAKAFFGDLFGDTPKPGPAPTGRERATRGREEEPPAPFIDLEPIEDDLDEKSGEIMISVEPSQAAPLPVAVPRGGDPPILELDWEPEISEASQPISLLEASPASDGALEDRSAAIDLVMPPPKKRPPPELDWQEPSPERRTMLGVPAGPEVPIPVARLPVAPEVRGRGRSPSRAPAAVIDVTPRSLGIGTVAGFCEELIPRNAQLPAAVNKLFATSRDGQDSVRIVVCQGESRRIENNIPIGELQLVNLPRRRRGETVIEVEFRLDASGILHVSARDVATGNEQRAKLDLVGGMPPETMSAAADRLQKLTAG